jgi:acylphosphatase
MGRDDRLFARRWFVSGRVQGVGFRYFVQDRALELGLRGFARNLADGRVEVYATGDQEKLNELAAALHSGPRMADVRGVDQRDETVKDFPGFSIR